VSSGQHLHGYGYVFGSPGIKGKDDLDREPDKLRDGILTTALPALFTLLGIRLRRRERLPDLEVLDAADAALEHEDA
jgi:hypothetical protein